MGVGTECQPLFAISYSPPGNAGSARGLTGIARAADSRGPYGRRMTRIPALLFATVALVSSDAIGAVIAVGSVGDVLTNGTKTSAPFWILVVELGAAYAFVRGRLAGAASWPP